MNYDRKIQTERLLFDRFRIVLHSINRLKSYESNKLHLLYGSLPDVRFFHKKPPAFNFFKNQGSLYEMNVPSSHATKKTDHSNSKSLLPKRSRNLLL